MMAIMEDKPMNTSDKEIFDKFSEVLVLRDEQSEMTILINLLFEAGRRRNLHPIIIVMAVLEVFGMESTLMDMSQETKH
jgi:hypothetical protein